MLCLQLTMKDIEKPYVCKDTLIYSNIHHSNTLSLLYILPSKDIYSLLEEMPPFHAAILLLNH